MYIEQTEEMRKWVKRQYKGCATIALLVYLHIGFLKLAHTQCFSDSTESLGLLHCNYLHVNVRNEAIALLATEIVHCAGLCCIYIQYVRNDLQVRRLRFSVAKIKWNVVTRPADVLFRSPGTVQAARRLCTAASNVD